MPVHNRVVGSATHSFPRRWYLNRHWHCALLLEYYLLFSYTESLMNQSVYDTLQESLSFAVFALKHSPRGPLRHKRNEGGTSLPATIVIAYSSFPDQLRWRHCNEDSFVSVLEFPSGCHLLRLGPPSRSNGTLLIGCHELYSDLASDRSSYRVRCTTNGKKLLFIIASEVVTHRIGINQLTSLISMHRSRKVVMFVSAIYAASALPECIAMLQAQAKQTIY